MSARTSTSPFPLVGLLVLAGAIFTSVTSEFLPTGLLPDMARDLSVSTSRVGLLVTIFAGTVVLTTTPLALLTRRVSRKSLVIVVMLVVALGNVLSAIAPTYELLVGARIVGGLAHGLFWAVVGAYAGHLVPKHQIARAVAITNGGATVAFVLGVPLGTALGHALGWRWAFAVIAGIVLVLAVLVVRFLPAVKHEVTLATGEIPLPLYRDRSLVPVLLICLVIILLIGGHNTFYTYVAPWLIEVAGVDASGVPGVLFLYGGAGAIGLVLAGIIGGRHPHNALLAGCAAVLVAVGAIALWPGNIAVVLAAIVLWGIAFGAIPPLMQIRILNTASPRMRDPGSAMLTTSFNLAIGGGALLGALLLDRSGLDSLPWAMLAIFFAGVLVRILSDLWLRARTRRTHPDSQPPAPATR